MARYWPSSPIQIAEPCGEAWEAMDGDARVRHCAQCERDVHNLAAMTPGQIEALLAGPGPLPCLRMAQREDGSLLTAAEARALPAYGRLAGAAMTALVSLSGAVASAQRQNQMTLGRMAVPQAVYSGQVVGPDGKPAAKATVYLSRMVEGGREQRVEVQTDAQGVFHLSAAPGTWQLGAQGSERWYSASQQRVTLKPGEQKAAKPILMERIMVTAGVPLPPPPPEAGGKKAK